LGNHALMRAEIANDPPCYLLIVLPVSGLHHNLS
jgi:hypothetical protein